MPLDHTIYGALAGPSPAEHQQQQIQLRDMANRERLTEIRVQQEEQDRRQRAEQANKIQRFEELGRRHRGDVVAMRREGMGIDPSMYLQLEEADLANRGLAIRNASAQLGQIQQKHAAVGQALSGLNPDNPQSWGMVKSQIAELDPAAAAKMPELWDEGWLSAMQETGVNQEQEWARDQQLLRMAANGQFYGAPAQGLAAARSQEAYTTTLKGFKELYGPSHATLLEPFDIPWENTPEFREHILRLGTPIIDQGDRDVAERELGAEEARWQQERDEKRLEREHERAMADQRAAVDRAELAERREARQQTGSPTGRGALTQNQRAEILQWGEKQLSDWAGEGGAGEDIPKGPEFDRAYAAKAREIRRSVQEQLGQTRTQVANPNRPARGRGVGRATRGYDLPAADLTPQSQPGQERRSMYADPRKQAASDLMEQRYGQPPSEEDVDRWLAQNPAFTGEGAT